MTDKLKLSIFTILSLTVLLLEISNCSFANATYTIDSGFTQIAVQSPISDAAYTESSLNLVADVKLIYGTSSPLDEFSFENLTCNYSVDGGEWTNFTLMTVTSNTASPDINFWNGFLHKLNITYTSSLQNLTNGQHLVKIKLLAHDSWGGYQDVAHVSFTTNAITIPTPTPSSAPSPTSSASRTFSPSPTLTASPSITPTESPTIQPTLEPTQSPNIENVWGNNVLWYFVGGAVIAVVVLLIMFLLKRK